MLLIVGAWARKGYVGLDRFTTSWFRTSANSPDRDPERQPLFPSLPGAREDPTKGGPDPFVNVTSLHPFHFRNWLLGIQVNHQTQLRREFSGQQGWEHRVGLIGLRDELQGDVLLRSLRQYFSLDRMNQNFKVERVMMGAYNDALDLGLVPLLDAESNLNPMSSSSSALFRLPFRGEP